MKLLTMLNLRGILYNTRLKTIFYEKFPELSYASVKRSLTSECHKPFGDQPKYLQDTANLHRYRRFTHTSNIVYTDIRYKDYVKMKGGLKVVDVRNASEIKRTGEVSGSFNIPLNELQSTFKLSPGEWKKRFQRAKPSEDAPIMVICASGVRSKAGVKMLQQLGYRQPMSFRGGYKMFKDKK